MISATTESPPPTEAPRPCGPLYAACGFPPELASVPHCRVWLAKRLSELRVVGEPVDVLLLIADELAANAVRHGCGEFEILCYQPYGGCVRIAVRDWEPRQPKLREATEDAETGRGLHLVAALSEWWGFQPLPTGKVVMADARATDVRVA
ncbi:hypothetical protein BGM09_01010 [Streptomyces sp. CBMA29]|nr:hypothetical protein [Streptomyces sp. CBMA29]